jgi:hypothetical protein
MKINMIFDYRIIYGFSFCSIILKNEYSKYTVFDFNRDFEDNLTNSFTYNNCPWLKYQTYNYYRNFIRLYRSAIDDKN